MKPPELTKAGYPKWMPVVTARDMCKGDLRRGHCRCLLGWLRFVFGGENFHGSYWASGSYISLWHTLRNACDVEFNVAAFADSPKTTLQDQADTWNRFIELAGYTEEFEVEE